MSTNAPVFPIVDLTTLTQDASLPDSQSSRNSTSRHKTNFIEQLSVAHKEFAALPDELLPSSCPSSPRAELRSVLFREKLIGAVNASNGEPSNPKWGLVHRMLRMGCTSRGYRGAAPGVRVGDTRAIDVRDYRWVLPEKEEQWNRCEERWKERRQTSVDKQAARASKYWAKKQIEVKPSLPRADDQWPKSRSQRIREKVQNWQARLISSVEETPSQTSSSNDIAKPTTEKEIVPPVVSRQTSLVFPASKHGAVGAKGGPLRDAPSMDPQMPTSSLMEVDPAPEVDHVKPADHTPSEDRAEQPPANIADVSEMSFLPPSFPTHLQTSTPKGAITKATSPASREKPPPIYPRLFFSSSPISTPFTRSPPLNGHHRDQDNAPSSSLPTSSPRVNLKRQRPLTPPDDDPFVSKTHIPLTKKKKTDEVFDRSPRLDHVSVPSSPPPPSSSPPSASPRLRSRSPSQLARTHSKDLGNAKGLPVLTTPDRNKALPTLSQLLASSRRSRPRPRPPSRKLKSLTTTPSRNGPRVAEHDGQDARPETIQEERDVLPEVIVNPRTPSPVRTFFSSPASGSSGSTPQSIRQKRLGSPISPLINSELHMDRFVPPFTSTQRPDGDVDHHSENRAQTSWVPPATGGFLGYSSQFDVDRQVDQVNELLDRDVDFDGWLKDIPEVEDVEMDVDEGRGRPPPTQDSIEMRR
ncbi:hypothetical protein QCA50_017316 [Cerrena zonata]|uniref:Uncharacterized protein n=1 Tax=Cerrena zonata TaxID=2478898 RepID=A0AAW0FDI7_9APHY